MICYFSVNFGTFSGGNPSNMLIIVCFIDDVVEKGLCLLLASSSPVLCYSIHVSNTRVQPSNHSKQASVCCPTVVKSSGKGET